MSQYVDGVVGATPILLKQHEIFIVLFSNILKTGINIHKTNLSDTRLLLASRQIVLCNRAELFRRSIQLNCI